MDKLKVLLAHLFSMHTLVSAFGVALAVTSTSPSLAAWHGVLLSLGAALGVTGYGMAATADPQTGRRGPGGAAALVFLVTIPLLTGCPGARAWLACTLGQLPQISQLVIPQFTQALSGDEPAAAEVAINAVAAAAGLTALQAPCVVKAVQADELARAEKVKGMRSRASINIALNADYYLKKHPATACGDTAGVM